MVSIILKKNIEKESIIIEKKTIIIEKKFNNYRKNIRRNIEKKSLFLRYIFEILVAMRVEGDVHPVH